MHPVSVPLGHSDVGMTSNLGDGHELLAFVRKSRRTTVSQIPQLKIGNACFEASRTERLLHIDKTTASLFTGKDKFTRSLLSI